MKWAGDLDMEDWADVHGYVRIHCKIHGHSWSDVGRCDYCEDENDQREQPPEEMEEL